MRDELPVNKIICGDALEVLKTMPDESIDCCITSPPYWALRDYKTPPQIWDGNESCQHEWYEVDILRKATPGDKPSLKSKVAIYRTNAENRPGKPSDFCSKCSAWRGSLGLEPTFELYLKHLWQIFDEIKRVLKKTGTCWVNLGDTYGGSGNRKGHTLETSNLNRLTVGYGATEGNQKATKGMEKSLCLIPFRFVIEMVNRGWILRNTIIWYKRNCMPSSVKDRFTVDFEYVFFFVKSKKYWFEQQYESLTYFDKRGKQRIEYNENYIKQKKRAF